MTLASQIRSQVDSDCVTRSVSDQGCSLTMTGVPQESFAIDLEHERSPVNQNVRHCDFVFIGRSEERGPEWVAPIELKGKGSAEEIHDQLQSGADAIQRIIRESKNAQFKPIIATKRRLHKRVRDDLGKNRNRISFLGTNVVAKLVNCGVPIAEALKR